MKKKFFNFNKLEIGKATCLLFFTLLHAGRDKIFEKWKPLLPTITNNVKETRNRKQTNVNLT